MNTSGISFAGKPLHLKNTAVRPFSLPSNRSERGFTLLELLVAMSLLSIIMIGLESALSTMAQTESKIDQRLERLDEIRVARAFLQQTLSRVSGTSIDAPGATGKTIVPFVATSDSLIWVGILPARANVGGLHFFRLVMKEADTVNELVLQFSPWKPDITWPDWSSSESRVLLRDIKQISIQAKGLLPEGYNPEQGWPTGWQSGWPITDSLPEQVRLGVVDAQGEWPEWNITLRALPQSDGGSGRTVIGGGAIR